jgi:hypothetical protein
VWGKTVTLVRDNPRTRDAYLQGYEDYDEGRDFNPPPVHEPSGDATLNLKYKQGWDAAKAGGEKPMRFPNPEEVSKMHLKYEHGE